MTLSKKYDIIILKLSKLSLYLLIILSILSITSSIYNIEEVLYLSNLYKVKSFIKTYSSLKTEEEVSYLAERFMSHGYATAKWLAATAKVETNFNSSAIGTSGEVSMFQILDWPEGHNPLDIDLAIKEALRVRDIKIRTWGNTFKALQAYNGNPRSKRTYRYAQKIKFYMELM